MMNTSRCPSVDFHFTDKFLPPAYILVFIVGLTANGFGLKFLLRNWKRVGHVNVFVLNLGLADVLYLLTLPFLVVYYFKERQWIFGDTFCKITRFCFNMNLYGSIGFLTCISVFRYLSIVHPMKVWGRLNPTHSVMISVVVWLLVSVQSLPDMFFTKTYRNTTGKCYDTTSKWHVEAYLKYSLGWTLTGFCLPFLITLGCYGHVVVILCTKTNLDQELKQRSLRLLLILMLLFSVCYIPYHILRNLNLWSRVLSERKTCYGWFNAVFVAQQISRGLVCLNPALNPLVYLHVNDEVSHRLRQMLGHAQQVVSRLTMSLDQNV